MNARLTATQYVWTAFAVAIGILFVTSIFSGGPGVGHIILGTILALSAFLSTAVMWGSDYVHEEENEQKSTGKTKRSLDAILSRLSDDELEALRDRLAEHHPDEDYSLGDDGELVHRR